MTKPELDDPEIYRMLLEGIPAIVYVDELDDLSTNFYTSPQAIELLGYTQQEWSSEPDLWLRKIHPEDRDRVMEENRRSNEELNRFFAEYRFITKDDREVWLRDEATPVFDDAGTPLYWRGLMLDITEQKQAEEKLRWSLDVLRRTIQQRRELSRRLEHAQEEERRRIAADIHDDPIQVMSAVDVRLAMMGESGRVPEDAEIRDLQATVQQAIERMRSLLFELRPLTLDREGLVPALRQYVKYTAAETGWDAEVTDSLVRDPEPEISALLYRVALEAITNARKHAGATRVEVVVTTVGDGISLRVRDDGEGFDASTVSRAEPGHIGLPTVVERAELAGGWCRITSDRGAGTTVECWVPSEVEAGQAEAELAAP